MGFFGKLFEKKVCDICGGEIGLLGNRKLEDGNMCKECTKKLSPWFDERRHSTIERINAQLQYREENKARVAAFRTTRSFGEVYDLHLDEDKQQLMVVRTNKIAEENPDVVDFSQVTGCELDIDERRTEEKRQDKDGNEVSYNPPRYSYDYDFYIVIRVNHPWFDDMRFKLNRSSVEIGNQIARGGFSTSMANPGQRSMEYRRYEQMGQEIREAILNARQTARDTVAAAAAPKAAITCPWCGATTMPDASGCCEYCGGAVNG